MSSERGNVTRKRAQKHQNVIVFKNDKYDKSKKLKRLNAITHAGVCKRCKEVLEWKIKYSKYKPLSQPRKCVKCHQKTVKDSYHIMCKPCAFKLELCAKCGKKEEIVHPLTSSETQNGEGDAETNPDTRSCMKESKGDEGGDANSTEDSDFDGDDGNNVKDGAKSIEASLSHPSTQQTDMPLQKSKPLKSKQTTAQGELDFSSLNLED
ncbi:uncharacterized protein C9orf85 homolog [Pristis pectinata]|uniref:uncharacterized protein C9orf85 homolog n=1 Tax=Pristis pectinata TaxID=685728 RepID=UPI00223E41B7|nr:uncharacterized protein C9orf85 homolog [Pristis pectinata]